MNGIDIKNFVDIDIKNHINQNLSGTRGILTLFNTYIDGTFDSLTSTNNDTVDKALSIFYRNGGKYVRCIKVGSVSEVTVSVLEVLPSDNIMIAYLGEESATQIYSALKNLAISYHDGSKEHSGIYEKMIFAKSGAFDDTEKVKNFVVKYTSASTEDHLSICGYLAKINVYEENSVRDYMFTVDSGVLAQTLNNEDYQRIITNNYNVDIALAGQIRDCGGNTKEGYDLVNEFIKIVLHQTLTNQLVSLLTEKLTLQSGISKIYSVMAEELDSYLQAGYLSSDNVWSDNNLYVDNTLIIEKGTALLNGYVIKVLPWKSADLHKSPDIIIILGTQKGIRSITISGEII